MGDSSKLVLSRLEEIAKKGTFFVPEEVALRRIITKRWSKHVPNLAEQVINQAWEPSTGELDAAKAVQVLVPGTPMLRTVFTGLQVPIEYFIRRSYRKAAKYVNFTHPSTKADIAFPEEVSFLTAAEQVAVQSIAECLAVWGSSALERISATKLEQLAKMWLENPSLRLLDRMDVVKVIENAIRMPEYWGTLSNLNTSRAFQFGMLDQAEVIQAVRYTIIGVLDVKQCKVCLRLHGKVFSVQMARTRQASILSASPDDIASVHPWPKEKELDNISPADLAGIAYIPPFHPRCRCLVTIL